MLITSSRGQGIGLNRTSCRRRSAACCLLFCAYRTELDIRHVFCQFEAGDNLAMNFITQQQPMLSWAWFFKISFHIFSASRGDNQNLKSRPALPTVPQINNLIFNACVGNFDIHARGPMVRCTRIYLPSMNSPFRMADFHAALQSARIPLQSGSSQLSLRINFAQFLHHFEDILLQGIWS